MNNMAAFRTWRGWVVAFLASVLNGFASGVVLIMAAPETFNVHEGLPKLLNAAGALGLLAAANFIKGSPFPRIAAEQLEHEEQNGNGPRPPGASLWYLIGGFVQLVGVTAVLCWCVSG